MNLAELLAANPPKPAAQYTQQELSALRGLWLVFPASLAAILAQEQAEHGDPHNVASPLTLTNGKYALCADLLTEVSKGGLFADGFAALPADQFASVDVISFSQLQPFLPQIDNES